jgi:uncharacterized protein
MSEPYSPLPAASVQESPLPEPASPAPPARTRAWGPWATLGWALLVFLLYSGIQSVVLVVYLLATGASLSALADADSFFSLPGIGPGTALAILVSTPVALGLVWLLARVRGLPASQVLALGKPTRQQALLWTGAVAGLLVATELLSQLLDRPAVPDFVKGLWTTTEGPFVPLLLLAVAILAPIFEEIFFRGFVFHGLGAGWMAIVVSTVLFTAVHAGQYDAFDLGWVAALSVVLGLARKYSGSTRLTIGLHVAVNALALAMAAWYLG